MALIFAESAVAWTVIGPYHDDIPAFLLWCGLGPILLIGLGIVWDSYARKLLSILAMLATVALGFVIGMAVFDFKWFQRVMRGSYLDDTAAYLALVVGAHLVGYIIGLVIHGMIGSARARRAED
jgi:hypothetical protein